MRSYTAVVAVASIVVGTVACSAAPGEDEGQIRDELAAACAHHAGSLAKDTVAGAPAHVPIEHVIVVTQENRSFDTMFGALRLLGKDVDGIPADFVNEDRSGKPVHFTHRTDTCFSQGVPHSLEAIESDLDGVELDRFVKNAASGNNDGHYVMGYYTQEELPFYYWLTSTYAISDRYFCSTPGPTDPNRDFLYAGTNDGITVTSSGPQHAFHAKTIYDALDAKHVSWGVYSDGPPRQVAIGWDRGHRGVHDMAAFFDALEDDKLPSVVFIDPSWHEDESPPHDVQLGEQFAKKIYDAIKKSKAWSGAALFLTYDEGGGVADHVPPPAACAPTAALAKFDRLGERVPVTLVSPYAKRGFVSHKTHSHTSILRFIELAFDVPALTARDANSDAMLDMFDFSQAQPMPDGPAAGHGKCSGDPQRGFVNDLGWDLMNDWDKASHGKWPF